MLKHENPNIEIVNPHLWAVRFSLIPMIPQITIERKYDDLSKEFFIVNQQGIVLLNKDWKIYPQAKKFMIQAMKLKPRQIRKELLDIAKFPKKGLGATLGATLWEGCLKLELERRKVVKK